MNIDQIVFNAIAHISGGKAKNNKSPSCALDVEVFQMLAEYDSDKIKDSINNLVKEGRTDWGVTLNNKYFKIHING